MRTRAIFIFLALVMSGVITQAQVRTVQDSVPPFTLSTGWADEAVTLGYVTAPSSLALMFVASLVNEWNAAWVGIPAGVMILAAPPLIYAGGRSVDISFDLSHPRARLGWTLYALSVIPTGLAMYGFASDWGSTVPLSVASAVGDGSTFTLALPIDGKTHSNIPLREMPAAPPDEPSPPETIAPPLQRGR